MLATWGTSTGRNPTLDLQFAGATSLDNRITFSRGSQATLFDSTGALVYAKHNLALQSEDLSTTWTTTGATVSANATTSPSGTTTADKLQEDTSTGSHLVSQNITFIAASHTASVFAKKAERDFVRVLMFDGTNTFSGFFNLSNGTIGTLTGTGTTATIADFGNGWYRCAITATTAAGSGTFAPRIALADNNSSYTGVAGNGIFMWGAQLNLTAMEGGVTSSLTTYYPTTTAAYYAPRFDYNPSTLAAQGLLIEEARTNSIRNNTMQGAVAGTPGTAPTNWAVSTAAGITRELMGTGTENGITYIDYRFSGTATGSSDTQFEQGNIIAALSGQTWAHACYFRVAAGSLSNVTLTQIVSEYTSAGAFLAASTQNITPTAAGLASQRFTLSRTLNNASTAFTSATIRVTSAGAIDITLRIGLPQLELGAFATSVIPTTTTALTRNADVASMTGTNFSSWFNAVEGTLLVRCSLPANPPVSPAAGSFPRISSINDNLDDNNIEMFLDGSSPFYVRSRVRSGAVNQAIGNGTTGLSLNTQFSSAIAYKINDFAASDRGLLSWTDTSGTIPTVNKLGIGNQKSDLYLNGYIQRISYYPVRLPNSTLQALTA